MIIRWLPLHRARQFVADHHRHLPRVQGGVIALGAYDDAGGRLLGVIILGRPVARLGDTGERLDAVRCAVLPPEEGGERNAASALYARARRLSQVLGLLPPQTHTLPHESGASLRGAGYVEMGATAGGSWARDGRERAAPVQGGPKRRWIATQETTP